MQTQAEVGAKRTPTKAGTLPLGGMRVLDFSHLLAGPFCTRLLADLGAEVLRVETGSRPDRLGATAPSNDPADRPPTYSNTNRNKRSITINLKASAGREVATRLASVADVVVENFSAGVMERLGLDYARLRPLNSGLIYVSMSGYGHHGPRRDWTSMNMNLQAYTGLMMVTGAEGDPPTSISNSWNDYVGGMHACFGILHALSQRRTTGQGVFLDLAQFECSVATVAPLLLASAIDGRAPARLGSRSPSAAPQGCYRCQGDDEWCVLTVQTDDQWRGLAAAMGRPEWASDPRFDTLIGRLRHHDEIDTHLERWTQELPNTEVEARLRSAGVPAQHMRRIKEVVEGPEPSEVYRRLEDPSSILATGVPFAFGRSAVAALDRAPGLGEHTVQALAEWLGATPAEIEALQAEGALV